MKTLKRATLAMVCISAVYLAIASLLSLTELSFREWVNVAGQVIAGIVTPIMVLVLALFFLYRNEQVHQALKTVCIAAAVIVCGIYVCFAMLFILLGSKEERQLTRHLLVTDESFLDETNPVYYRPTAFFFKRQKEITAEDKAEYLEKKYGRTFGVHERNGKIYDESFPEVTALVWADGMSLYDNYVEMLTFSCLVEAHRSLHMEREYHIMEKRSRKYLCLEASGYDDIPALSADLTALYQYVLSGKTHGDTAEIYKTRAGTLYYSFGEDGKGYTGMIRFGGLGEERAIDVEALVRIAYQQNEPEQTESAQNPYADGEDHGSKEESFPESEPEEEWEPDEREEAAKRVYGAALAEEGFSYEVCYNAKGNLYIDLGTKVSEEDGKTYSYRLVYDRTSKNSACELLVLYRSVEGSDEEAIVDMYAVENATGKVIVSGKKAWSDVGTEEYREMTGE